MKLRLREGKEVLAGYMVTDQREEALIWGRAGKVYQPLVMIFGAAHETCSTYVIIAEDLKISNDGDTSLRIGLLELSDFDIVDPQLNRGWVMQSAPRGGWIFSYPGLTGVAQIDRVCKERSLMDAASVYEFLTRES